MEENTTQQSWWKRNWKWALPTGGCLLVLIVFAVMVGMGIYAVSSALTESEPSTIALEKVKSNEEIISLLGEPIEIKGIPSGNYHYENDIKTTSLAIPLEGPEGTATLRVDAEAVNDEWTFSTMMVTVDNEDNPIEINLLNEDAEGDF